MSTPDNDKPTVPNQENSGSDPSKRTGAGATASQAESTKANASDNSKNESPATTAAQEEAMKAEISAIQGLKDPRATAAQEKPKVNDSRDKKEPLAATSAPEEPIKSDNQGKNEFLLATAQKEAVKAEISSNQGKKESGATAAQEEPIKSKVSDNQSKYETPAATAQKEAVKAEISSNQGKKETTAAQEEPIKSKVSDSQSKNDLTNAKTPPTAPAGKFTLFQQRPATPPQTTPKVAVVITQTEQVPQPQTPTAAPAPAGDPAPPPPRRPRQRYKTANQWRRYQRRKNRRRFAPKRPMTAYMAFVKDHYKRLDHVQGPKATLYGVELGRVWRTLNGDQKAPFVRTAMADRARWDREKQRHAHRVGPKRPRSAYAFFVKEIYPNLPKVPNQGARYYGNELGRRWRTLGIHERGRFQQMAREDLLRYIREKTAWVRQGGRMN